MRIGSQSQYLALAASSNWYLFSNMSGRYKKDCAYQHGHQTKDSDGVTWNNGPTVQKMQNMNPVQAQQQHSTPQYGYSNASNYQNRCANPGTTTHPHYGQDRAGSAPPAPSPVLALCDACAA